VVGSTHYSIVSEPDADDLSTYYVLSIDESLQNYVGTHLAVTSEGLWVLPAATGYKVLIATGNGTTYTTAGTYIIDAVGNIVARFGETTQIGENGKTRVEVDYHSLKLIDLDNEITLLIHLRMTGQLIYRGEENFAGGHPSDSFLDELPNRQTRVEVDFEAGKLFFNDQRKFGFIKVLKTCEVESEVFLKNLAKEPTDMTRAEFYKNLMRHQNQSIKATILDQKVIAGVGNIYADEALFLASIHPARKTGTLSKKDAEKLLDGIKIAMQKSIAAGGSTMKTYVKADGTKGDYLKLFANVFNRENEPCKKCQTKIIKIRVAGRGTHLCPNCQKEQK
jgi:formamidopyrimidine-DNA glycosylase